MFDELDEIESVIGTTVERMTPQQLAQYFKRSLQVYSPVLETKNAPVQKKVREMMEAFPSGVCGRLVKWAFVKHKGLSEYGEPLTNSVFSQAWDWQWTIWYREYQSWIKEQELSSREEELRESFISLEDL